VYARVCERLRLYCVSQKKNTWKQSCGTVVPKIPFASSMGKGALTDEPDAVDRH
jgi:hypothetical protein